jgi:Ni/Co efflux regulator RcnB
MNKRTIAILLTSAAMALSSVMSVAQARDDRDYGRGHDRHGRYDRHDRHDRHDWRERRDDRRHYSHGYERGYRDAQRFSPQVRYYSAPHRWSRGDRLPRGYHQRYYVVNDWHGRHLHRPAPGYHWVQSGSEFLLVAIATGVITSVILAR